MENSEKKIKLTLCDGCVLLAMLILISLLAQPLVTQAVSDKKLFNLTVSLKTVRCSIALYKAEHGLLPGQQHNNDRTITSKEFIDALTQWSAEGNDLYRQSFPVNPYVSDTASAGQITCVSDANAEPTGTEATGWWLNTATGRFYACDSKFHTNY